MSFQAYIDNIKIKTRKTPADFKKVGHGHSKAIYALFKGKTD